MKLSTNTNQIWLQTTEFRGPGAIAVADPHSYVLSLCEFCTLCQCAQSAREDRVPDMCFQSGLCSYGTLERSGENISAQTLWGSMGRNTAKCLPRRTMSHGNQTLLWHLPQHGNIALQKRDQRHGFCKYLALLIQRSEDRIPEAFDCYWQHFFLSRFWGIF